MRFLLILAVLATLGHDARAQESTDVATVIFEEIERRLLRDYYEALRRAAGTDEDSATTTESTTKKDKKKGKGKGKGRKNGWVQGIPPGHLPPPGLCRAWLPDTPPGHQPEPGTCYRVARDLPEGARLVYGGARGKDDTLPPGLGERLPDDLVDLLPITYPDTERVLVDDDVYLIRQSTRLILDVLENVLKEQ